jgi:hypothetical protein
MKFHIEKELNYVLALFVCKYKLYITSRTHDAPEQDLRDLLLGGACHPVKGCAMFLATNNFPRTT